MRFVPLLGGLAPLLLAFTAHSKPLEDRSVVAPYVTFTSKTFNGGLRYVNNSGVCETTKGVHTASGYIDIAQNQSLVREKTLIPDVNTHESLVVLVLCSTREP